MCIENTKDGPQCKDCCDCLDIDAGERTSCRDECATHDFSSNSDLLQFTVPSVLGKSGDYSKCVEEGNSADCKQCCEVSGGFVCGDYRFCRDQCNLNFGSGKNTTGSVTPSETPSGQPPDSGSTSGSGGGSGGGNDEYSIEQAISDQAQESTIAFDALAFLTGNRCADSFLPPGKVADFFGYQYLRDTTPNGMGHNTDFVTNSANNVLAILNDEQKAKMIALAKTQPELTREYAYKRYLLIDAFRRQYEGDIPEGSTGLSKSAVMNYSAELYLLDAQISMQRAELFGEILRSLDSEQKAKLDAMVEGGFDSWEPLPNQIDPSSLTQEQHVLVMTYASEMFGWYAGSVEADTYFCPERQGTYFGSFFMKDAPAMGNAGYTIDETITGNKGQIFLTYLTDSQSKLVTDLVDLQRDDLEGIVEVRRSMSTEFRKYQTQSTIDEDAVNSLAIQYGEYDGELIYYYATHFAEVGETVTDSQMEDLIALRDLEDYPCPDGYMYVYSEREPYSEPLDSDFLFGVSEELSEDTGTAPVGGFGSTLLGVPTADSIILNVIPNSDFLAYVEYGVEPDSLSSKTGTLSLDANEPVDIVLDGLSSNSEYFYRIKYSIGSNSYSTEVNSFHTARPSGSSFTFAIEADPHLDGNSLPEIFNQSLQQINSDKPDFLLDLGDTFMCEKLSEKTYSNMEDRYILYRGFFDELDGSVPLFLVNGNHEGENGWELDGTSENIAIWTTELRKEYYPGPVPDGFYTGDSTEYEYVGLRESYYSFEWGDALFVVLDPYWNTAPKPNSDLWGWTLGEEQYDWLKETLENSNAKHKFVFAHHIVGGNGKDARGGANAAPYYEWGGDNLDGTYGFDSERPGWGTPIHELLVDNGVDVFFHGHDHMYAKEELDGVVYQEIPQPSHEGTSLNSKNVADYGYSGAETIGGSGYMRVSVTPSVATVEFVRYDGTVAASYEV